MGGQMQNKNQNQNYKMGMNNYGGQINFMDEEEEEQGSMILEEEIDENYRPT